jgi:hypothetical protein
VREEDADGVADGTAEDEAVTATKSLELTLKHGIVSKMS